VRVDSFAVERRKVKLRTVKDNITDQQKPMGSDARLASGRIFPVGRNVRGNFPVGNVQIPLREVCTCSGYDLICVILVNTQTDIYLRSVMLSAQPAELKTTPCRYNNNNKNILYSAIRSEATDSLNMTLKLTLLGVKAGTI